MGRTKKTRKIPITVARKPSQATNSLTTRSCIRRFHVLLKKKAQLQTGSSQGGIKDDIKAINDEIEALGGLQKYQEMSTVGQSNERGGGSHKILISWLKDMKNELRSSLPLQLLEVGALKPDNYASITSWISVTPIDLHSQHPSIKEQDFFLLSQTENAHKWDVISLSLVVNFVPEPKDRGKMLRLSHQFLKPDGLLFLVLPFPCVQNSRYLSLEHLDAIMNRIGFTKVKERWKTSSKVAYWLYRNSGNEVAHQDTASNGRRFSKKIELAPGSARNNFAILL